MIYNVEFPDGSVKKYYYANVIANNMYLQVDQDKISQTLLESIIDYRKKEHKATNDNMCVATKADYKRIHQTTVGWKLLVKFRYGYDQWVPLKILKENNPIEVSEFSEFATARDIADEPGFCQRVPYTLRKRDPIISAVTYRARNTSHEYGIEVPRNLDHAKQLISINVNCLWQEAIELEMSNVRVVFEILDHNQPAPIGCKASSSNLVSDVKTKLKRKD